MFSGKARAYTNIALIKYWGKENQELIIPMNNSLSLTLDAFYTETHVTFSEELIEDQFYLDNQLQDSKATLKVSRFLNVIRDKADCSLRAIVKSQNFVPTAAGLASSASGLAALAGAASLQSCLVSHVVDLVLPVAAFTAVLRNGKKAILMKPLMLSTFPAAALKMT